MVLGRSEYAARGGKEEDDGEQRRAAVQTVSDAWQGVGGALQAIGRMVRPIRGAKQV